MAALELVVNGERRTFERVRTLADVLGALALDPRAVVVEHNREIVRRPALDQTPVAAEDTIEIVHFVGGG
ncbi:MAG: sulfur carrier protein ThiS [Gemmatimonadales bacterium]